MTSIDARAADAGMARWWGEEGIWLIDKGGFPSSAADIYYNDRNCPEGAHALIDSCASGNVAGVECPEIYASMGNQKWHNRYSISKKRFRFVDGVAASPIGTDVINAKVKRCDAVARPFLMCTDVVIVKVPILISR